MTDIAPRLCNSCVHLTAPLADTCSAFPNGIPRTINEELGDHRSVRRDQTGTDVFEMIESFQAKAAYKWWKGLHDQYN